MNRDNPTPFLLVIGDSHVRSFSQSTAFLPIFIGAGNQINFISRSSAADTIKTILSVLGALNKQCEKRVIVYASEPATRIGGSSEFPLRERAEALVECLDAIRKAYALEPIAIAAPPTSVSAQNVRSLDFNRHLRAACDREGILCVDLWEETAEPNRDGFGIKPKFFADGIHLGTAFGDLVREFLSSKNIFPGPATHVDLDYVYHVKLQRTHSVRVRYGAKMAQSMLAEQRTEWAARAIDRLKFDRRAKTVLIGCSDGYPALRLASRLAEITGVDDRAEKLQFATRLSSILGMPSVTFLDALREVDECRSRVENANLIVIVKPAGEYLQALLGRARCSVIDLRLDIRDDNKHQNLPPMQWISAKIRRRLSPIELLHPFPR